MKKIRTISICSVIVLSIICLTTFVQSCSNKEDTLTELRESSQDRFNKDLQYLSTSIKILYSVNQTRGSESSLEDLSEDRIAAIQQEISVFLEKYDVTDELSMVDANSLYISEGLRDSMYIDHSLFYKYLERNRNSEYIRILNKIFDNPSIIATNEIISNDELNKIDKVELVITKEITDFLPENGPDYKIAQCDEDYADAISDCQIDFAFAVAGIIASLGPTGGSSSALAAVALAQYAHCLYVAGRNYNKCKGGE